MVEVITFNGQAISVTESNAERRFLLENDQGRKNTHVLPAKARVHIMDHPSGRPESELQVLYVVQKPGVTVFPGPSPEKSAPSGTGYYIENGFLGLNAKILLDGSFVPPELPELVVHARDAWGWGVDERLVEKLGIQPSQPGPHLNAAV